MSEPTPDVETQPGDDLLAELADDFLRRHRAGERPSVDEYAASTRSWPTGSASSSPP